MSTNPAGKYWSLGCLDDVPKRSLGCPEDVPMQRPQDVPWRFYLTIPWTSQCDVLIWRSRDIPWSWLGSSPGRSKDVHQRTFKAIKLGCPKLFFQNLFIWPNLSKSIWILKVYWEPSRTSTAKLVNDFLDVNYFREKT